MVTFAQVRPHSSEIRAPVRAATVNSVRYGSVEADSVCSICSGVNIGSRLASDTFGRSDGSSRLVGITPLKPRRGELEDATGGAEHGMDRRLALPFLAQVADHRCQLVCGDAVQSAVAEAHAEVLLHGAAVAGLGRGAQVEHRASKPQVSCLAEPEPGVGRDRLATSSTCKQFVPNLPGRHYPAVDGAPALDAGGVLEADLEHAGRPAIDVALDADAARRVARPAHATALNWLRGARPDRRQSSSSSRRK
ncbi:MAG: hypothetical protein ACYC91_18280 [Solirubrobacteraceae bacterium]